MYYFVYRARPCTQTQKTGLAQLVRNVRKTIRKTLDTSEEEKTDNTIKSNTFGQNGTINGDLFIRNLSITLESITSKIYYAQWRI